jgi:hypothetical protein
MTLQRMDNVLIVVEDLEGAKAFFAELELEGETQVEGLGRTRLLGSRGFGPMRRIMFAVDDHRTG